MICPVQTNGYCRRHRCFHRGPLLAVSQDPGPDGERHRALWDRAAVNRAVKPRITINDLAAKKR